MGVTWCTSTSTTSRRPRRPHVRQYAGHHRRSQPVGPRAQADTDRRAARHSHEPRHALQRSGSSISARAARSHSRRPMVADMTLTVINERQYIDRVFSNPGTYELTAEGFGSPLVNLTVRQTFVDPSDEHGARPRLNALQDAIGLRRQGEPPVHTPGLRRRKPRDYPRGPARTRGGCARHQQNVPGDKADVEPTRHLIGTALWVGVASARPSAHDWRRDGAANLRSDTRSRSRTCRSTPSGR